MIINEVLFLIINVLSPKLPCFLFKFFLYNMTLITYETFILSILYGKLLIGYNLFAFILEIQEKIKEVV